MPKDLSSEQIRSALNREDPGVFQTLCSGLHATDLAEFLLSLDDAEVVRALSRLDPSRAADVFSRFDLARQTGLTRSAGGQFLAKLLEEMDADDRASLIREAEEDRSRLIGLLDAEDRRETELLAAYPKGSVGSVMSTEYAAASQDLTVREALDLIRTQEAAHEGGLDIYVVDDQNRLAGVCPLADLLFEPLHRKISEVMSRDVISVHADDDFRLAVQKVKTYDIPMIPVVQATGRLVGVITIDDVLDVQEETATEDFHRLGSVITVAEPFHTARMGTLYRARIPWLLGLVFINLFSGSVLSHFEETLRAMILLAVFLPLLIDSGGNAGAQAATLVVRALATGDIRPRDWRQLFLREIAMSAALGLTMGLMAGLLGVLRGGMILGMIVGLTMVCVVTACSLLGLCLPFLLTRLKLDPATASSPLVTSLADGVGVLIYLGIARHGFGL